MSFQTSRRGGTIIIRAEGRIDSSFYRLHDGKIVEASHVYDRLHEQSQLS